MAALEDLKESNIDIAGLSVGNEGWKGAVAGALAGCFGIVLPGIGGAIAGSALSSEAEKKIKEVEKIAHEIEKVAETNGKNAVNAGKLSSADFNKNVKIGAKGIIGGAILGALFGPFYGAIKGHQLEELRNELEEKLEELDKIVKAEAKRQGKVANESNESSEETVVDTPVEGEVKTTEATTEAPDEEAATADVATTSEVTTDTTATSATDVAPGADPIADAVPVTDTTNEVTTDPTGEVTETTAEETPVVDPVVQEQAETTEVEVAQAETAETTPETTEVENAADEVEDEIVEEEMGEVDAIDDTAEDADEDVEKLVNASEALEGIVAVLDAAIQRGGLDVFGASLARNNLNTITTSLKVRPMVIPAMEDMETPLAKVEAASGTKDQIVKFIKRILDTLKQAFDRFSAWTTEIYKRLTNAFMAIEKRAATLLSKAQSATMKEGAIDSDGLRKKLISNGKVTSDVPDLIDRLGKLALILNNPKTYDAYLEVIDLCEQMSKDPSKEEELRGKISGLLSQWASTMEKLNDKNSTFDFKVAGNDVSKSFGFAMLNNEDLSVTIPSGADGVRMLSSRSVQRSGDASGEVQALSQAEAIALCKSVAEIAKAIRESGESNKGGVQELVSEIKKRKETIAAIIVATEKSVLEENNMEMTKMRKAVLFVNTAFLAVPKLPVHAINKALPRNLQTALDYVAASIGDEATTAVADTTPKQLAA